MGFLLAQIIVLLLVAALGGALLMYWWLRRQFEDVTVEMSRRTVERDRALKQLDELEPAHAALLAEREAQRVIDPDWRARVEAGLGELRRRLDPVAADVKAIKPVASGVDAVAAHLRSMPVFDMQPVLTAVEAIRIPPPKEPNLAPVLEAIRAIQVPKPVDLGPVLDAIAAVPRPREPDLSPVLGALGAIEVPEAKETDLTPVLDAIATIPPAPAVNLDPVLEAIRGLPVPETDLRPVLDAIAALPAPAPVDLSPVLEAIRSLRLPEAKEPDLSPVLAAVGALPAAPDLSPVLDALGALPPAPDLTPLEERLDRLEAALGRQAEAEGLAALRAELAALREALEERPPEPAPLSDVFAEVRRPDATANLLLRPAFGPPDDLKVIKGVGPKLERLLHGIGVFYFWQVAEWSAADVEAVDDLLEVFKGRIERDAWVSQGRQLQLLPESAKRPS